MAIKLTSKALWQLLGYLTLEGRDETGEAEVFPGIGFYARPPRGSRAEAIMVHVGGAKHPAVVASREEKTRARVADIGEDEAIVFSSAAVVHIRSNGTVEVRLPGGTAVPLATKADVAALKAHIDQHKHQYATQAGPAVTSYPTSVPATVPALDAAPAPAGTSVLRGQ